MSEPNAPISLSEVLAGLSTALDLTEGQPAGHAVRTCFIGSRIADELNLSDTDRWALYYTLLLKDAGCSSNASRFAALFATRDQDAKHRMKLVDWHRRVRLAARTFTTAGRGESLNLRVRHFVGISTGHDLARALIQVRCDRGADIVARMGFPAETSEAIRSLDEHWCGKGYPAGLHGEAIPLLSRIANVAQNVELFFNEGGKKAALTMIRARRGTWFDPRLCDIVLAWKTDRDWWTSLDDPELPLRVVDQAPTEQARSTDAQSLDVVARGFADIIDAKSPYTFRHSSNVAELARGIAMACGLGVAAQQRLYRAGLLHDIGKLGVSSRILDSAQPLSVEQRHEVERHPELTWQILGRVSAFRDFSWLAATHHEKLDASGYPWGLHDNELDLPARILVVADIYEALTADRPYRDGMSHTDALRVLLRERSIKLSAEAIDGLVVLVDGRERASA